MTVPTTVPRVERGVPPEDFVSVVSVPAREARWALWLLTGILLDLTLIVVTLLLRTPYEKACAEELRDVKGGLVRIEEKLK